MQLRYTVKVIFVKGIALLFITFFLLYLAPASFAKSKIFFTDTQLKQYNFENFESINSNQLIYPFKKYWENLILTFTFDESSKRKYFVSLYQRRFKELVYIINNDKTGFLPETVDRYNTFAGKIKSKVFLNEKEKQQISDNLKLLEKLRDRYHSGSAYWVKIQEAVDTTKALI